MTKDELAELLRGEELHQVLDIKTLVLDIVREDMTPDEIAGIFWTKLPGLDISRVKDYIYMKRS